MRNLHNFVEEKHRKESLHSPWKWENLQIKDSDYRNHHRFTLRHLSKDVIPVSVRLKSRINTRKTKQIIHKLKDNYFRIKLRELIAFLRDNTVRLDRCRSRLASLVTSTTMDKCTNFINKVKESRFSKVRDRQVNKFNRLMGKDKDRYLTTQPLANST